MKPAPRACAALLAFACFLSGRSGADELNEKLREQRQREEGMYRQIEDVNKPAPSSSSPDPSVGTFLGNFQDRMNAARAQREQREYNARRQRQIEQSIREDLNAARRKFDALDERARAGDEDAMTTLAYHYLLGTYANYDIPQDVRKAEYYTQMRVNCEDDPKHNGYSGYSILLLGGLQFLRGDFAAARTTWLRLDRPFRGAEECTPAEVCLLALRLLETGPNALPPEQSRIVAGILAGQAQVVGALEPPKERYVMARVILDVFRARPDLAPTEEDIWRLERYFTWCRSNFQEEARAFEPKGALPRPGAQPPPPIVLRELGNLRAVARALQADNWAQLYEAVLLARSSDPDLRPALVRLIELRAATLNLPAEVSRKLVLQLGARWDGPDSAAAKELAALENQIEEERRTRWFHDWVKSLGDGNDAEQEGALASENFMHYREAPVPMTPAEARRIYDTGHRWAAGPENSRRRFAGAQLVTLAALGGFCEPPDGEQAAADVDLIEKWLDACEAARKFALYGATHGPEAKRVPALAKLAKYDQSLGISLATPLGEAGVAGAAAALAEMTFPCEETLAAMQRAHRWKLAAQGDGEHATDIIKIEAWLTTHDAVRASHSPALRDALAALASASAPAAKAAAVDRLCAVTKDEYRAGSFFAYDELQRFACSPADADGRAAWFLATLGRNRDNSAVGQTDEQAFVVRGDSAALLVRAAGRGWPAAVEIFRNSESDSFGEAISLDDGFSAVEACHWPSLIGLAGCGNAKTGMAMVNSFTRALQEPATLVRVVQALRAGTIKDSEAMMNSSSSCASRTRCLDALLALAPRAEKDPAAWPELLAAVTEFPKAPHPWQEGFGPYRGELYALYLRWTRARNNGGSGEAEIAAYCRNQKPGAIVCDAFVIGRALSNEPIYSAVVSVHDEALGAALLERAIAAGFPAAGELRRRYQEDLGPYGEEKRAKAMAGELWPLPVEAPAEQEAPADEAAATKS